MFLITVFFIYACSFFRLSLPINERFLCFARWLPHLLLPMVAGAKLATARRHAARPFL